MLLNLQDGGLLDPIKEIIQGVRESALCLDFNTELGLFACCFQRSIRVFTVDATTNFFTLLHEIKDVSDNISACHFIKTLAGCFLIHSTFDGKIELHKM
jgi:hypothetical protein